MLDLRALKFEITPFGKWDKDIEISTSDDCHRITVDHDDVDHAEAEQIAKAIVGIPAMLTALDEAHATFERYAIGHYDKAFEAKQNGNREASDAYRAKGDANMAMAKKISEALLIVAGVA